MSTNIDDSLEAGRPLTVEIVAIGVAMEALLCRSILESLGMMTCLSLPGSPDALVRALNGATGKASIMVICGHGADGAFEVGEFGAQIDASALDEGRLYPRGLEGQSLTVETVVSTCCTTGNEDMAARFLGAGARTYIAPRGWPDGRVVPLFLHMLFRDMLLDGLPVRAAVERANAAIPADDERFTIFTADSPPFTHSPK
jgi:hypothetical protein